MNKKAIILDLDNTIYPVESIGEDLFKSLFNLIENSGDYTGDFAEIKKDLMRKPFQKVASEYSFSQQLTDKGTEILKNLAYDKEMFAFEDYAEVNKLPCKKFLVTAGFTKMQQSKVKQLGLEQDFEKIYIIDSNFTDKTKKDIFMEIAEQYGYKNTDILIIGDDYDSEITAATDLGMAAVLYDKMNFNPRLDIPNKITDFQQLKDFI